MVTEMSVPCHIFARAARLFETIRGYDFTRFNNGNYFCSDEANWRQELVMVIDGGECYFQVEYDVEGGLFTKLLVNGEA